MIKARVSGEGGERLIELDHEEAIIVTKAIRRLIDHTSDAHTAVRQAGGDTSQIVDHFTRLKKMEQRFSQASIDTRD